MNLASSGVAGKKITSFKVQFVAEEGPWNDTNCSFAIWPSLMASRRQQRPSEWAVSMSSTSRARTQLSALSIAGGLKKNKSMLVQQLAVYFESGDAQSTVLIMKERLMRMEKGCAEGIKDDFSPLKLMSLKADEKSFRPKYRASLWMECLSS